MLSAFPNLPPCSIDTVGGYVSLESFHTLNLYFPFHRTIQGVASSQ